MTDKEFLDLLLEEFNRVTAEDAEVAEELDDTENSFNDGWASGMSRAIQLLREHGEGL